jgi:N-acetylmuramoyl-L-alanine amidase
VLREHSRPAVLVECGFLSNPGDEQKLNTASHQSRLASVIAEGIADALR